MARSSFQAHKYRVAIPNAHRQILCLCVGSGAREVRSKIRLKWGSVPARLPNDYQAREVNLFYISPLDLVHKDG